MVHLQEVQKKFWQNSQKNFAGYRDEMIISTKAGYGMWPGPYGEWGSRKYLLSSLDQSLQRLGTDYVDIFIHTDLIRLHLWKKPWKL